MTNEQIYKSIQSIRKTHPSSYRTAIGLYDSAKNHRGDAHAGCMALAAATAFYSGLEPPEKKKYAKHKSRFH